MCMLELNLSKGHASLSGLTDAEGLLFFVLFNQPTNPSVAYQLHWCIHSVLMLSPTFEQREGSSNVIAQLICIILPGVCLMWDIG